MTEHEPSRDVALSAKEPAGTDGRAPRCAERPSERGDREPSPSTPPALLDPGSGAASPAAGDLRRLAPPALGARDAGGGFTVAAEEDDPAGDRYIAVFPGTPLWSGVSECGPADEAPLAEPSTGADVEVQLVDPSMPPAFDGSGAADLLEQGKELLAEGRREEALAAFRSAVRVDPDDLVARSYLTLTEDLVIRDVCPGWSPGKVPRLAVPPAELAQLGLDIEVGQTLSRIDGALACSDLEALFPNVDRVDLYRRLGRAIAAGLVCLQ